MQAYQQRVVEERQQLEERRQKLAAFLDTEVFQKLTVEERTLLREQFAAMSNLSLILEKRIGLF
jgi:predicted  nucleic acid-binding Zn-ribbon protein